MRKLASTRISRNSRSVNRSRIQSGFLAEDYDGIGQYVLINTSHGSVAAAYRARVASGDFGTGQVMPIGTPVAFFIGHGRIEIMSMGAK